MDFTSLTAKATRRRDDEACDVVLLTKPSRADLFDADGLIGASHLAMLLALRGTRH